MKGLSIEKWPTVASNRNKRRSLLIDSGKSETWNTDWIVAWQRIRRAYVEMLKINGKRRKAGNGSAACPFEHQRFVAYRS